MHSCTSGIIDHNTGHNNALYLPHAGDSLHLSLFQKVFLCEVYSIGSDPCSALPCPALPCPAFCMSGTIHVLHWHFPGLKICAQRLDTLTFKAWSAVFWTWSRVGGNGHAPPLHPSRALRPCQNTQSTQQTSLMAVTMWSRAPVPTPTLLSSGRASTRRSNLMSLPNSGCVRMQSSQ